MKKLIDYIKENNWETVYGDTDYEFSYDRERELFICKTDDGRIETDEDENELIYRLETVQICQRCGRPMMRGFADDYGEDYFCEDCFEKGMDELYGVGKWKPNDTENGGECGGFYDCLDNDGNWVDTGMYYTEWN